MDKYHVKLTDEERMLVEDLQLRVPRFADVREIYTANENHVVALVKSLCERDAIPPGSSEILERRWTIAQPQESHLM